MQADVKPEARVWLWRAETEHFYCDYPLPENDAKASYPANGDGLLLTNGENAIGVRRIYLARHISGDLRFYFDRIMDFDKPLPLAKIAVDLEAITDGNKP